jgi:hypothetical protein
MIIKFDTKGWTQEQINMIQAMAVSILYKRGIGYDSIKGEDEILTVENPKSKIMLTEQDILDEYVIWKEESDAIDIQNQLAEKSKQTIIEQATKASTKEELQKAVNDLLEII